MQYEGPERRSSPDTIMLLQEIQKIAVIAGQTSTNVDLLRADVGKMRDKMACQEDVETVDKKINDHIENHRFNIGTLIATISGAGGLVAGIAAFLSIPKGGN